MKENYEGIVSCLQEIELNLKETSVIDSQIVLQYMQSDSFIFWLNFYYPVFNHVSILFSQMQSRNCDISVIKSFIHQFTTELNKIKDNFVVVDANKVKEVADIIKSIIEEISNRLEFNGHLLAESLLDNNKFPAFDKDFPTKTLDLVIQAYPFLNSAVLRGELEIIYSRDEFRSIKCLLEFRKVLLERFQPSI